MSAFIRAKTIDDIADVCEFHINWPFFRDLMRPDLLEDAALSVEQRACIFWMMQTMDRIGPADLASGPHLDYARDGRTRMETTLSGGGERWKRN
ncbi:MAG: hypothetical protein ACKVPY_08980 [Paracoccaceae bacterium]